MQSVLDYTRVPNELVSVKCSITIPVPRRTSAPHVLFLVDCAGEMSQYMDDVSEIITAVATKYADGLFAIRAYSGVADDMNGSAHIDITDGYTAEIDEIPTRIAGLQPQGVSDLSAAIHSAADFARSEFRIVILTDGERFNNFKLVACTPHPIDVITVGTQPIPTLYKSVVRAGSGGSYVWARCDAWKTYLNKLPGCRASVCIESMPGTRISMVQSMAGATERIDKKRVVQHLGCISRPTSILITLSMRPLTTAEMHAFAAGQTLFVAMMSSRAHIVRCTRGTAARTGDWKFVGWDSMLADGARYPLMMATQEKYARLCDNSTEEAERESWRCMLGHSW